MELEMTRVELERLIELAYLGERVIGLPRGEEAGSSTHAATFRKLLALADASGLGYLVETDEATGELKPSAALTARVDATGFLQDYDDFVFWDELSLRLAERDLAAEIGREAYDCLPPRERQDRVDEIALRWDAELDKHGLDRLQLPDGTPPAAVRRDRLMERLKRLFDDER